MSRQAKTLTSEQFLDFLNKVARISEHPVRDYVTFLLSHKAGLRAGEIAKLQWRDVLDASGNIGIPDQFGRPSFVVPAQVAKKGHMRTVPMNPALQGALSALRSLVFKPGTIPRGNIIWGDNALSVSPNTLQKYMARMYRKCGYDCTSHSGRRTMITKAIRAAPNYECSIKDVQSIVGHKYIDTTERYIELSDNAYNLIRSI